MNSFCEAVNKHGRGLRVTFVRHGDRIAHTVAAVDGDRFIPLLASDEGTDQDDWPHSPPFQELSVEHRDGGNGVALLVGMAGTSHWSLSVETNAEHRQLAFDVACRVKEPPSKLGSAYRAMVKPLLSDGVVSMQDLATVVVDNAADFATHTLHASEGGFIIEVDGSEAACPSTIRWRYTIVRSES